jgi:hypothetical protein
MMQKTVVLLFVVAGLIGAAQSAQPPIVPDSPELAVSFYRIRVELKTTSDWTSLEPEDLSSILAVRQIDGTGELKGRLIRLSQPIAFARSGQEVAATVDYYILASGQGGGSVSFAVQKGGLGETSARVYCMASGHPDLIDEESVTGQHDSGTGAYEFSATIGGYRQAQRQEAKVSIAPQKLLWAFYYPWYGTKDWSSEKLKDHPATPYSSGDKDAITRHIDQAQSAGIDGFVCSWWGPDDQTDKNLKTILDVAQQKRFLITIYLETITGGKPRAEDVLHDWLSYAIQTYGSHPAFMKLAGKPLIVVWASDRVPLEEWQRIFTKLRGEGLDAAFMAQSYDVANLEVFDGVHQYGIMMPGSAQADFLASVARRTRYYAIPGDVSGPKVCAGGVVPGYDDTLIPGRKGLSIDRKDGAYYSDAFDVAIKMDPDWIFITSWNEWWENTYIEPSELYGDQYLQITREYSQKWKGKGVP